MDKADLLKLKEQLPRGAQKRIAEILHVSQTHVCQVLSGDAENEKVIKEAIAALKTKKTTVHRLTEELRSVVML